MRTALVLPAVALAILSVSGLALAQGQPAPPATATPPAPATPAPAPAMPVVKQTLKAAGVKHMLGQVVSANSDTRTLTVRHTSKKRIKEHTFSLTGDAAAHVADYKPGDSVRVTYVDDAGRLVAQSIMPSTRAAKK